MRRAAGRVVVASLAVCALSACGRLRYEPGDADAIDAPGLDAALDAITIDASIDAPGLDAFAPDAAIDAPGLDAPSIDAPSIDAAAPDAALDRDAGMVGLPTECLLGTTGTATLPAFVAPMAPVERRVVPVADTAALTAALAVSMPGDVIELEPGVSYRSAYVVSRGDLTIRTRAIDAAVPATSRVAPTDAPALARIVSGGTLPSLSIEAPNVRVVGLEIATDALDAPSIVRTTPAATDVILERLWVHGSDARDARAGLELNGARTVLARSHVSEIHANRGPRPAVLLYTFGSSMAILDNHLESSGEGVVFGTEVPLTPESAPSDAVICRNHITRPLTWYPGHPSYAGIEWPTGPLIGVYDAERVLIAGNVIERAWETTRGSGARALSIVPGDLGGAGSGRVVDVTFVWNHVRDVPEGISLGAGPDTSPALSRVFVGQSLFEPIELGRFGADTGRIVQLLAGGAGPISEVVIDRVTAPGAIQNGLLAEPGARGLITVRDSILATGAFGFVVGTDEGIAAFPDLGNLVVIGPRPSVYGASSTVVASVDDVGFVEASASDWALSPTSPFFTASSTGGPVGCDVETLRTLVMGVAP
ncbi:MAG: hypothetical protein J0L92_06675 [Deltaproteobacteria bacterium]|nr:hypothetical protein [Deltaproteobacteria bacterium]